MPHRDAHPTGVAVRDTERHARRRYQIALAVAVESLRHAEQRFDESSAAIDAHIQRALAAAASLAAVVTTTLDPERNQADADPVTLAPA
ncbi:MAG TPA: hypothetical protein VK908_10900 [Jiangellales bacterium]|nr:hypothetical protein [Jiangellales bacterium]